MNNLRKYGKAPFSLAVIHGRPGAPGYMAPVARELSTEGGVLEPLQTASSLQGQIQELKAVLDENATLPVTLIGSSWGAMLSLIFTACHSRYVRKLVLIGSAVFEEKYDKKIMPLRLSRLNEQERAEAHAIMQKLHDPSVADKNASFTRLAALLIKSDTFDPLTLNLEVLETQHDLNQRVWREAEALRENGALLELAKNITCPVVAIHGDYDPHPAAGVQGPLSRVVEDFKFILLDNCGHYPWIERKARDQFYAILRQNLQ